MRRTKLLTRLRSSSVRGCTTAHGATSFKIGDEHSKLSILPCSASAQQLITSDNGLQLALAHLSPDNDCSTPLAHLSPELHVQQAAHRNIVAPARPGNARDATCNLVDNGAALATETGSGAPRGRAGGTPAVAERRDAHHVRPRRARQGAARCIHQIVVACRHRCDVRRFGSTRLND